MASRATRIPAKRGPSDSRPGQGVNDHVGSSLILAGTTFLNEQIQNLERNGE